MLSVVKFFGKPSRIFRSKTPILEKGKRSTLQAKLSCGLVRIVLDTNIIISGLLSSKGPPGLLLQLWLEGKFELVTSKAQLEEMGRVFDYKKIRERIPPEQAADFLDHIGALADVVETLPTVKLSPDPDDNRIIATAIKVGADLIVSGDKTDLLSLKKAEGIPIITARQAVNRFKRS